MDDIYLENQRNECEIKIELEDLDNTCGVESSDVLVSNSVEPSGVLESDCVEPSDVLDIVCEESCEIKVPDIKEEDGMKVRKKGKYCCFS